MHLQDKPAIGKMDLPSRVLQIRQELSQHQSGFLSIEQME
jgi:hypothetical protein